MASELVNSATNDKLTETDWMKNIQICELVSHDYRQAKDVIKAIKKRLGSKRTSTQLFAVVLLEMLMNNIGESIHKQVIDTGLLPVLVKIVKKSGQSDLPVREKIFLLLDATQTSLGGASGRFPQYYQAYYELVSSGVQFPQRPQTVTKNNPISGMTKNKSPGSELHASQHASSAPQAEQQIASESSIIQKADAALEVLREVLDAVDSQHPEGAKDEFTLDLVEQCSFQKQRIMHLAVTSRDEKVISRAIELNEQLEKVLTRHDALISGWSTSISNHLSHEEAEEEEAEQLFQRIRKGKARAPPEIEDGPVEGHLNLGLSPGERMNQPFMKPLTLEPKQENNTVRPVVTIPPPPAKHVERERFFQENKLDGSAPTGHEGPFST